MKKINFLFNLIIALGIFVILGAAGGSDTGTINFSEIIIFSLIGSALIAAGNLGKRLLQSSHTTKNSPTFTPRRVVRISRLDTDIAA